MHWPIYMLGSGKFKLDSDCFRHTIANSEDSNEMASYGSTHPVLHCLPLNCQFKCSKFRSESGDVSALPLLLKSISNGK